MSRSRGSEWLQGLKELATAIEVLQSLGLAHFRKRGTSSGR